MNYIKRVLLSALLICLLSTPVFAVMVMTNYDCADVMVVQLDLDGLRPGGYAGLSDAAKFTVDSGILADVGITNFVGGDYDHPVIAGEAADVIYTVMTIPAPGAEQNVTQTDKLNYLVNKGVMTSTNPVAAYTSVENDHVINSPAFVENIATHFSEYTPTAQQLVDTNPASTTGVKLDDLNVEPDITAPYNHPASPTI